MLSWWSGRFERHYVTLVWVFSLALLCDLGVSAIAVSCRRCTCAFLTWEQHVCAAISKTRTRKRYFINLPLLECRSSRHVVSLPHVLLERRPMFSLSGYPLSTSKLLLDSCTQMWFLLIPNKYHPSPPPTLLTVSVYPLNNCAVFKGFWRKRSDVCWG